MKKSIIIFSLILILSCNSSFATEYTEDNAAYWYQKAFRDLNGIYETNNFSKSEDNWKISKLTSLDEFNKLTPETKKILERLLKNFFNDLKKAKSLKKCVFGKMPTTDKESRNALFQFNDLKLFFRGYRLANALAWYAISLNKPDIAGAIWQTMLDISMKISEHNLISERTNYGGFSVKLVIPSLDNYFENGASKDFKAKFIRYFKKWPISIFDIRDSINVYYEYQKTNVELYSKDLKFIAIFFGANQHFLFNNATQSDIKPIVKENKECASTRRTVQGAIEMYQMDESEDSKELGKPDFSVINDINERRKAELLWVESKHLKKTIEKEGEGGERGEDPFGSEDTLEDNKARLEKVELSLKKYGISEKKSHTDFEKLEWDEIVPLLLKKGYIRGKDFSCPANGKRSIKTIKNNGEYEFEISCNCSIEENPMDDFKPDSKPMKLAKDYRESKFETDKKQLIEYYEMLLKLDYKKTMTEREMSAFDYGNIPEYRDNVLLKWLGLRSNFKKSFESYSRVIDDFLAKHEKMIE